MCLVHIVITFLQQLLDNILNILTHIACLGEGGCIGDGKGNIEHSGQGFRQQGLTATGWANQQDITFTQLNIGSVEAGITTNLQSLVVVVDGYRENSLGALLANHILVEVSLDF